MLDRFTWLRKKHQYFVGCCIIGKGGIRRDWYLLYCVILWKVLLYVILLSTSVPMHVCVRYQVVLNHRSQWSSYHALTWGDWRFASPRLCLGIIASLLSVSIGSQHIVWLVYTVWWEQWICSSICSIRPNSVTRLRAAASIIQYKYDQKSDIKISLKSKCSIFYLLLW